MDIYSIIFVFGIVANGILALISYFSRNYRQLDSSILVAGGSAIALFCDSASMYQSLATILIWTGVIYRVLPQVTKRNRGEIKFEDDY